MTDSSEFDPTVIDADDAPVVPDFDAIDPDADNGGGR